MIRVLSLACLLLLDGSGAEQRQPASSAAVYGVLPMRNLSASQDAIEELMGPMRASLEWRGASFVPGKSIDEVLRARRIRYTDSLSREDARAIGDATGAQYLVAGTLLEYSGGEAPEISVALRILDAARGRRIQSTFVALTGEQFRGVLGIGAITGVGELALEVVARILEDFDAAGAPLGTTDGLPAVRRGRKASSFVAADFDPSTVESVAIMPPVNRTERLGAALTLFEALAHQWSRASGVEVVEQSELRAAMIRMEVRSLDFLDEETYARLGRAVGARYFVLGSIDRFNDGIVVRGQRLPQIEASVRLLDVERARVVSAARVHRRGDAYHALLGLGNVRDLTTLTLRVASELIALIQR